MKKALWVAVAVMLAYGSVGALSLIGSKFTVEKAVLKRLAAIEASI